MKGCFNIIHFSVHLGANSIQLYNKHSKKVWDLHLHHFGLTLFQINPFINFSDISMLVLKFKRLSLDGITYVLFLILFIECTEFIINVSFSLNLRVQLKSFLVFRIVWDDM